MKRIAAILITISILILILAGCQSKANNEYTKYSNTFYDAFDTITIVVGYNKSEEEFNAYYDEFHTKMLELHRLYDIYNDYEGINNIKTINDNAGIKPVKVDKQIIDLIQFSKAWYGKTGGVTNIAMGAVLRIWHNYREEGIDDPNNAKLPPMEELQEAAMHTDINKVIVDTENNTVFLEDPQMSLDVGAVAKGFATEIAVENIMAKGFKSGIISAGGNVRVMGKPLDNIRKRWGVGIQNPDKLIVNEEQNLLDTIFLNDASVVTSGDYQRYYFVNGRKYHHLIDPKTLMPGDYYKEVTIVTKDAGIADFLSTTAFLMPFEEGKKLIDSLEGVDAIWVMQDGKIESTDNIKKIMKSNGATGASAR